MRNMKRYLSSILGLMLIFSLIGCSSISENSKKTVLSRPAESNQSTTKKAHQPIKNTISVDNKKSTYGNLKVHYINVGQADSILIEQGSSSMLIDAGNNEDSNTVKNYISEQGITKLDYIVGTHPHEDHIGGLDYVIKSFQVGKIYMPKVTSNTKTFQDVVSAIKAKGMKVTLPIVEQTFKVGSATATILAPNSSGYEDLNNYSIVIRVTFGNNSFMFDGDAEDISENEMLSKGFDVSADVIKIGHHGSNSSTSQAFLDKVNPKYAVISVGKGNSYGHPHKSTMEKLQDKGIKVYRTDESGTIVATSNGNDITFNVKPGSYTYNGTGTVVSKLNTSSKNVVNIPITKTKISSNVNIKKVYFTQKGKSYHYDKNCSTLKRSKTILEGSKQEAISSGHTDPCNICAGGN
ncbi:ComEC/Rec2 family competence protein [Clostridium psychrophilum]|uniref:ComEC/Rec2 family competence protein n=1 Tax=Clostridium psychrophilum TaxID=132926 RepID=UPI001C0D7B88|nr:ComEC/Rec2 family competence protein [Clostridium psychrophilum]MBU3182227.1 MBL fold metallo-hydrolase [Clostridium psychrophilum]